MRDLRAKRAFVIDMDGVIYHGERLLPGAREFVEWLKREGKAFLFLTNSSVRTPADLRRKLGRMGMDVDERNFYTSALATADFLSRQKPGGSAYVIGGPGLVQALQDAGFTISDASPDYVVVGETDTYNFERLTRAINLVRGGARLIGANPDLTGPDASGIVPATGALMAPIELSTGAHAFYVGKPNPLIMRHALKRLGAQREDTAIVGDRMDTDIIAGVESEITTILVLSGVTTREDLARFAYRPDYILDGVGDIPARG